MKTKLCGRLLAIACASALLAAPPATFADILAQYTFGPDGTTPGVLTPTLTGANLSATSITADPGMVLDLTNPATQPPSTPYLRTTFTTVSPTPDAAILNEADFKFTLTANAGFLLDLSSLTFDVMRGGGSTPRGYDVRSSVDNFAATLRTEDVQTVRPVFTPISIDLSGAPFQDLSTITFKIFGYSPGTGSSLDYDNIVVNGMTVTLPVTGYLWRGTVNANWDTATANWSGPGTTYVDATAASDVIFDDTATVRSITVTPSAVNPDSITLSHGMGSYTFGGSSITVAGGLSKTGAGAVTFNNVVTAASVATGAGTLTIGTGGMLTSPQINVGASSTVSVDSNGALGATSGLVVQGNLILNNLAQTVGSLDGGSSGMVTLNSTVLNIGQSLSSYDGKISGSGSIVKNSAGTITLNGADSDFTGGITISGGAVRLGGISAGGAGPVTVNTGGRLALAVPVANPVTPSTTPIILAGGIVGSIGNQTVNADLNVTADSTVNTFNPISGATPSDLIILGRLLGTANLEVVSQNGNNPDSAAFRLRGPVSNYSGTITVRESGKFELQTAVTSGSQMGTGTLVVTGGTTSTDATGTYSIINVRNNSAAGGVISDVDFGNNVRVIGAGTSFFNLLGSAGAGSVVGFGDLLIGDGQAVGAVATGSAEFTVAFSSVHLNGGTITFTPQPVGNSSFDMPENIRLGTITQNSPSGITMNGAATLTLAGAGSYTGATLVESGTLAVNGSITGSSGVSVNGGTLTGSGTIESRVIIGDGNLAVAATVDPGGVTTVGTLTTGALNLNNPDAQFQLQINSDDLTRDLLAVNGALTLGPGVATLSATDLGFNTLTNGERFTIATATGGVSGFFATYPEGAVVNVGSNPLRISYQNNAITLAAVPEPGSLVFLLGGLAGALALPRSRRRGATPRHRRDARSSESSLS